MPNGYKLRTAGLALLLAGLAPGCGENPASTPGAWGTAVIALKFTQGLGVDLDRVEVIATAPDMRELRRDIQLDSGLATGVVELPAGADRALAINGYDAAGGLLYTGSGRADITAGRQVRLEVTLAPARAIAQRLAFGGVGAGATTRFALTAQQYALRVEYHRAITVDLVDELSGRRVARLWQATADGSATSTATRALRLQAPGSFFLYIRDTAKAWSVEIQEVAGAQEN